MLAQALKCLLGNGQELSQIGRNSKAPLFTFAGPAFSHVTELIESKTKKTKKSNCQKTLSETGGGSRVGVARGWSLELSEAAVASTRQE